MIPEKEIIGNSIPTAKKCLTMEIFGKKFLIFVADFFLSRKKIFESLKLIQLTQKSVFLRK